MPKLVQEGRHAWDSAVEPLVQAREYQLEPFVRGIVVAAGHSAILGKGAGGSIEMDVAGARQGRLQDVGTVEEDLYQMGGDDIAGIFRQPIGKASPILAK